MKPPSSHGGGGFTAYRAERRIHVTDALLEPCCLIVDDFVGTQRADEVQVLCQGYPGHVYPTSPGQLHREAADTARRAVDQYGAGQPEAGAFEERLPHPRHCAAGGFTSRA